jgi:hypothetical protein
MRRGLIKFFINKDHLNTVIIEVMHVVEQFTGVAAKAGKAMD